jgi:hypothetical protein
MSGLILAQPVKDLTAADVRHDQIQNYQVNLLVGIGENADGIITAAGA